MDVVIRFRIDGALQEVARLPKERYENLLNRIKVQSRLRMDEHFATQDGSLRYDHNTESVDLRTSIAPTIEGEKIVLRVLGSYVSNLALTSLGLSDRNMETLDQVTRKPFGMILVTGPTGSGKTTTLYALVKSMNETDVNITTIEDPVEYKLLGINQIQVNLQTDLTFAKGLRSIVRQDPDIILVGEIRDNETAEIAVNAALTGHLLLSTFHANDAATAIPRLLDMGIEPFLLASTLNVILAQRLVRKICKNCKHSMAVLPRNLPIKQAEKYFGTQEVNLYEGGKCVACNQTGYKDRVAITELIVVTPQMQALILTNPSSQQVWALARQQGTRSLFEDGLDKVKEGVTSLDELLRVAEAPADVS
jgi:type II secretory ATPase GspE/PulE/Tfp pilus assembly ATPase PilB-like protein